MRGGVCFQLANSVHHISENDFGSLLPTLTATAYGSTNNGQRPDGSKFKTAGKPSLSTMAKMGKLPTPIASDSRKGGGRLRKNPNGKANPGESLTDVVVRDRGSDGKLNPQFTEWMMGWPIGATDLKPLETDKFQSWLQRHSSYLQEVISMNWGIDEDV